MAERRSRNSLYRKAVLLAAFVTFLAAAETVTALLAKDELSDNFERITELDGSEQEHLLALWIANDLLRDLASPGEGLVFVRVGEWISHVTRLAELEAHLDLPAPEGQRLLPFQDLMADMNTMFRGGADTQELVAFSKRMSVNLNVFTDVVHDSLLDLRDERAARIDAYRSKSDLYAWSLLGIGLFGLLIVLGTGGAFLSRLVRALGQLEVRAKEITEGNYGRDLETDRADEVGQLVRSVNRMAATLESREKEAEEFRQRLFEQEKMFTLGSFAAGIAHEVGNPIQAIVALTGQVADTLAEQRGQDAVDEVIDQVQLIAVQAERLGKAVEEIREFTHSGPSEKVPSDLNQIITSTLPLLRFDRRFRDLHLELRLAPDLPAVPVVPDHIVQVLLNLLINAADAVEGQGGRITVSTARSGTWALIRVEDDGCGIPPEQIARVKEPFFTTKPRGKGTGLGLAVCSTIVEEHDGQFEIDSRPGRGTTMTIRLTAPHETTQALEKMAV